MVVHNVLIIEVRSPTFGLMIVEDRTVQLVWIMVWCLEVWVVAV